MRLGYSRDGVHFQRPADRRAFLRPGPPGRFDSRVVWILPFKRLFLGIGRPDPDEVADNPGARPGKNEEAPR